MFFYNRHEFNKEESEKFRPFFDRAAKLTEAAA